MAHSHAQSPPGEAGAAKASPLGRAILLSLLGIVAVATVVGLVLLWPDAAKVEAVRSQTHFVVPGATFEAGVVDSLADGCDRPDQPSQGQDGVVSPMRVCQTATVTIRSGPKAGESIEVVLGGPNANAGIATGDSVRLLSLPDGATTIDGAAGSGTREVFFGVDRSGPILVLLAVFVLLVLLVAWIRGLLALVGLVFSGAMILVFMLPAVVGGAPGVPVALVTASAILFVVLYLAHGPSIRTSSALAGTLCGIAVTALIAQLSVGTVRLSGMTDEAAGFLTGLSGGLDFRGVLTCAMIVAGLGVLNDVTITQSSSVWELRAAGPGMSRRALFWSAMRIGRDHIASTIYTIVFAYVGTSLAVLLLLYLYNLPVLELLTFEDLAAEIVTTLCSAIGLVLAVPITTAIAVLLVPPAASAAAAGAHGVHGLHGSGDAAEPPVRRRTASIEPPERPAPARPGEVWRPLDWEF
ncbi:MAG: YibE/F family protein [Microbacteriaceae bacterium]|nr:YibE/F family protein [Microbacteriaceae bacterium]